MAEKKKPPAYSPTNPEHKSLLGKVGKLKTDAGKNPLMFGLGICSILSGSSILIIPLAINLILPIVGIIIGAIYLNDCRLDKRIPIWLITFGAAGSLSIGLRLLLNICNKAMKKRNSDYHHPKGERSKSILELFIFIWVIVGAVWVYSVYKTVVYDDTNSALYCQKTVYLYSFSMITIYLSLIGLYCLSCCIAIPCICCACACCACCIAVADSDEENNKASLKSGDENLKKTEETSKDTPNVEEVKIIIKEDF